MSKMLKIIRDDVNEEVLSLVTSGPAGFRMYELLHLVAYVIESVADSLLDYTDKYRIKVMRHGINFDAEYFMSTGPCGEDHFVLFI